MNAIRLVIVEDHEFVRQGLITLIQLSNKNIEVVGEAGTAAVARKIIGNTKPDVLLLDLQLPDIWGIDLARELHTVIPEMKILILSSFADKNDIYEAILAGASGYLLKQTDSAFLLDAIIRVHQGETLMDANTMIKLFEYIRENESKNNLMPRKTEDSPIFDNLTTLEMSILKFVGEGKNNKEIANHLNLKEATIRNYLSQIYHKIGVNNRTEAAIFVHQHTAAQFDMGEK